MKASLSTAPSISKGKKAVMITCLMMIMSCSPLFTINPAAAHQTTGGVVWEKQGYNDTGWVRLNATGASAIDARQATANWELEFAPGALISNVTMEIRVNGSNNLMIEEPTIGASDVGVNLFDWKGLGMLGSSDSFTGSNPYSGRLAPNSDTGAFWTLPSGAEINELIIEALAPVDPAVGFEPVEIEIADYAIHFVNGQMYLAVNNALLILDYNNDPQIIDTLYFDEAELIVDLEIDTTNLVLHILTNNDNFHAISLLDTSEVTALSDTVFDFDSSEFVQFEQFAIASDGTPYAANEERIAVMVGADWNNLVTKPETGRALDIIEVDGIMYFSFENGGVERLDLTTNTLLTKWTTDNNLHSDSVTSMHLSGNQLLFASEDAGLARYDWGSGFWLSTWSEGNGLSSNNIADVVISNNIIGILNGGYLQTYNSLNGLKLENYELYDFALLNDGNRLIKWPVVGSKSPSTELVLISDGSGELVIFDFSLASPYSGNMLIASGPTSAEMDDAVELNGVLFVAADGFMNRYDSSASRWLNPKIIGDEVNHLITDGNYIYLAGDSTGAHKMDVNGTILESWSETDGLLDDNVNKIAISNDKLITINGEYGLSIIDLATNLITVFDSNSDLDSNEVIDVATYGDIAYIATADNGLARYDLINETFLTAWGSNEVNFVESAPIAVLDNILHMGLPGYGVVRKDLSSNEILAPLVEGNNPNSNEMLADSQVYALISDGSYLFIGTEDAAIKWDGSAATYFQSRGNSWVTQPRDFYDFALLGGDIYVGTDRGVCRYPISTVIIDDCINVYDGMPDWDTYRVGTDGSRIFGGTEQGVGVLTTNPLEVIDTWEAGEETENAPIEVIGDIAYVGLNGIGVARFDISTNSWLPTWTEYSGGPSGTEILDPGNGDVTGLVADVNPNQLWIGGEDGFQLIDVVNEEEVYDIEKSNSLYLGNGEPYQMTIYDGVMYYHQGDDSNSIYRIDVVNFNQLSNLDAGIQLSDNSGPAWGMGLVDGIVMASVASNGNSPDYYDGRGGIAQWDSVTESWSENIEPAGQVDRVTAYQSTSGDMWISWGELRLDLYDSTGNYIDSWNEDDGLEFPIREIVEYDGEVLFATEEGVARFDPNLGIWLSTWEENNGLPNNAGEEIYEIWTNGIDLVIGGANGFQRGAISHWDGTSWNIFTSNGQNGIQNGLPITMTECGGLLNIGIYSSNGGIEQLDLASSTIVNTFTQASLNNGRVSGVACDDSTGTLYVTFYEDEEPIKRYNTNTGQWISDITTQAHNLPSDRIWWDAVGYDAGQLIIGHGLGQSGPNIIGGGFSVIATSGSITGQVNSDGQGSSVTSFQWTGADWLLGQAGGSSGYSHVDRITNTNRATIHSLPGLVSGQVTTITGNATHIWVTTIGDSVGFGQSTSAGVLQGERQLDGTVLWQQGWTLPVNAQAKDTQLVGTDLYISTTPTGLMKLDTATNILAPISGALHNNMDGLKLVGNKLIIGLQGTFGSSAGIEVYDLQTGAFSNGKLLAGLPSNYVNSFAAYNGVTYIATDGGIARYRSFTDEWLNPITTTNGLPINLVQDLLIQDTNLWATTPLGLVKLYLNNDTAHTITSLDGMLGTSAWGLVATTNATGVTQIHVSHDGLGSERPGITSIDEISALVAQTHRFDQLSSNTVTAIAADWWGVHIATDVGPITHWNGLNGQFEDGVSALQIPSWPIEKMVSNGDEIMAVSDNIITILEARTSAHSLTKVLIEPDIMITGGFISQNYLWATTADNGLFAWANNPQWPAVDRFVLRQADPLNIGINLVNLDITDLAHPGTQIELASASNPIMLDSGTGSPGVHNLLFQGVPLAFTSPVTGAATWAKSNSLQYAVTLNLSSDPQLTSNLQLAVDRTIQTNGTKFVQLDLSSPSNGSLEVRITYDYIKLETPIDMIGLVDRPDDGGSVLTASWTLIHDDDFSRYLVYLNEGPFGDMGGNSEITAADLSNRAIDKSISLHSRLQSDVTTANGVEIIDGVEYYAIVVVEYDDGRLGKPSKQIGPAISTNEVPQSPKWVIAGPHESGNDGYLELEWSRCSALDLASTRIYTSRSEISDVIGLTPTKDLPPTEGNTTILKLNPGRPYWIAITCVDLTGLEDILLPTVIGPVVPTGGLNDFIAPPGLTNVSAIDTPNDDGGRITVSWDQSIADDCAFYAVWIKPDDGLPSPAVIQPLDVSGFSQAEVIDNCETTSAIIDGYDGLLLSDGQQYLVGVVAYDDWLNVDLENVEIDSATPISNTDGVGSIPDRVGSINAYDHPNDDGTAIDVGWTISTVDDFAYYIVWAADQPVSDLSGAWAAFGDDPAKCGCLKVDKQWIDEDKNPIQLTISTALYGDSSNFAGLSQAKPELIKPNVELFVTITVHDIKGNVHLTDLPQAKVTPINNLEDGEPPNRLVDITLEDRPGDDGTGLLLDFALSDASDVEKYEIYAWSNPFTSVVLGGGGPTTPIAILNRSPELPYLVDSLAADMPVVTGLEIWATVVVRDTAGNAYLDDLFVVKSQSIDDGFDASGDYIDSVSGLNAKWDDNDEILLTWNGINGGNILGYKVYISDKDFVQVDNAIEVGEVKGSTNFRISSEIFEQLDNQTTWFVAVAPFDDYTSKQTVDSVEIAPVGQNIEQDNKNTNQNTDFSSLLTTPNLLAAGLLLVAIILLIAVVRTRNNQRIKDKSWELQEATWGLQDNYDWGDKFDINPSNVPSGPPQQINSAQKSEIYSTADTTQSSNPYQREAYQPQQPVLQPQNIALLNDLGDAETPKPKIDTSFLDDLL